MFSTVSIQPFLDEFKEVSMNESAVEIEEETLESEFEVEDEFEVEEPEVDEEVIETEAEAEETEEAAEDEDDEVVIQIGEESPSSEDESEKAPEWVREVRKVNREQQREIKKLKQELEQVRGEAPKQVQLGSKPTLESADYDTDVYEKQLTDWYERKRQYDAQQEQIKLEQQKQQEAWQNVLTGYVEKKAALKVRDYDEAEAVVEDTLNTNQQGMILQGADDPALLVYALGKNPKKAQELASIHDPVKFAFAVAKLETQLKVTNRKAMAKPEKTVKGAAPLSGSVDSTLERLRAEAERTGDYTKVIKYKRQKKR